MTDPSQKPITLTLPLDHVRVLLASTHRLRVEADALVAKRPPHMTARAAEMMAMHAADMGTLEQTLIEAVRKAGG